jgi:hypothetical protein
VAQDLGPHYEDPWYKANFVAFRKVLVDELKCEYRNRQVHVLVQMLNEVRQGTKARVDGRCFFLLV